MTKTREIYICSSCGSQTMQWRGQCPNCHEWNTLQAAVQPKSAPGGNRPRQVMDPSSRPIPLRDVEDAGHEPYGSGLKALDRVLAEINGPVRVEGGIARVSASIGYTLYPADASDADLLLRHADQAMYLAKEAGKNQYRCFAL